MMLWKVKAMNSTNSIDFGFERLSDAVQFMQTCVETIDGIDDGEASVTIYRKEEQEEE